LLRSAQALRRRPKASAIAPTPNSGSVPGRALPQDWQPRCTLRRRPAHWSHSGHDLEAGAGLRRTGLVPLDRAV